MTQEELEKITLEEEIEKTQQMVERKLKIKKFIMYAAFITSVGLTAVAFKTAERIHDEQLNYQPELIRVENVIEVGDDGMAHTTQVNYYQETTDPIVMTDPETGEKYYTAPAGYTLSYDENGKAICTRVHIERDINSSEEKRK